MNLEQKIKDLDEGVVYTRETIPQNTARFYADMLGDSDEGFIYCAMKLSNEDYHLIPYENLLPKDTMAYMN